MPDTQQSFDLTSLDSDYTIVGELGSSPGSRTLIAERKTQDQKRRGDHTGVIISIYSTPEGDEANALAHLAADTKALAAEPHRRIVPVIEGRWLDDTHFAVVTQRITDPTIAQRLAGREMFSTVRIAAILRELNGLLEWARDKGIVHRTITGESVHLEPRTDRVRVMFDVTPIHRVRPSDETRDGRTIARLAMAMLAGVEDPDACSVDTLHEMRPELPARLAEATAELLDVKNASTKTDIVNYIALIGMSDPLYRGEEEEKRIRAEILEEQRLEREKLANERAAFEAEMAQARADFEAASTKERADFAAYMQREKDKLEGERTTLQKAVADERAKMQKALLQEREELTAKRTQLEKEVAAQKAELERVAALDRKSIEDLRAELKRRGEAEIERKRQAALEDVEDSSETELDEEELAAPLFVGPNIVPLEALTFNDDNELLDKEPVVFEAEKLEPEPEPERAITATTVKPVDRNEGGAKRNRWLIPGAIGGGVAVLGAIAFAVASNANTTTTRQPTTVSRPVAQATAQPSAPPAQWAVPLPAATQILDSAGGSIAPAVPESTTVRRAAPAPVQTTERPAPTPERNVERPVQPRRERSAGDAIFDFRRPDTSGSAVRRVDSALTSTPVRRDTVPVRRDSVTPPDTTQPRRR